jgi:hypothetical protein
MRTVGRAVGGGNGGEGEGMLVVAHEGGGSGPLRGVKGGIASR